MSSLKFSSVSTVATPFRRRPRDAPLPLRKKFLSEHYRQLFQADSFLLAQHNNLSVKEFTQVRQKLALFNFNLKVLRIGVLSTVIPTSNRDLRPFLFGPTCLISPINNTSNTAKEEINVKNFLSVLEILGKNKQLVPLSGKLEGRLLSEPVLKKMLQELPTLEALHQELLTLLRHPSLELVKILKGGGEGLMHILKNYKEEEKKE